MMARRLYRFSGLLMVVGDRARPGAVAGLRRRQGPGQLLAARQDRARGRRGRLPPRLPLAAAHSSSSSPTSAASAGSASSTRARCCCSPRSSCWSSSSRSETRIRAMARHRSSAVPLAWLYGGADRLCEPVSLHRLADSRASRRSPSSPRLAAPWWTGFDLVANLLGYLPLGALLFGALVRSGGCSARAALVVAVRRRRAAVVHDGSAAELPAAAGRVERRPACSTPLGTALGRRRRRCCVHWRGGIARWQTAARSLVHHAQRRRHRAAAALAGRAALPDPGAVRRSARSSARLQRLADRAAARHGRRAEGWQGCRPRRQPPRRWTVDGRRAAARRASACSRRAWSPSRSPRPGWRRLVLVLGAVVLGCRGDDAVDRAELRPGPRAGLAHAARAARRSPSARCWRRRCWPSCRARVAAGFGLIALDGAGACWSRRRRPIRTSRRACSGWEQGRFIRFHGAAQWVGWLWPYAAIALPARADRGARGRPSPAPHVSARARGLPRLRRPLECPDELLRAPHLLLPEPARQRRERRARSTARRARSSTASRASRPSGSTGPGGCASTRPAAWTAAPAGRSPWSIRKRVWYTYVDEQRHRRDRRVAPEERPASSSGCCCRPTVGR